MFTESSLITGALPRGTNYYILQETNCKMTEGTLDILDTLEYDCSSDN
uniref:Uncharacterized protein n=1 Tax=Anguilla anguilla TaxID=7936 RepID=A0A0E9SS98_ANGAN